MPAFQLAPDQVADLATFLHAAIFLNANRRLYQMLDIVTGDPKAGEAFFNGAGKCSHVPLADRRSEGRRREVRRRHAAGAPADAARRTRRRAAAAGLSRQERDQGHGDAAVAPDRHGRARPAHRLRRHALRSGRRADPLLAAQRRRAESRRRRSAAGARRHVAGVDRRRHAQHDGLSGEVSNDEHTRVDAGSFGVAGAAGAGRARRTAGRGARSATLLKAPTDSWPTYHGDYSGAATARSRRSTPTT